ncbi:pollen-specific leucine-rich repeat extensin-like protein 4 isoform X2 [Fopius arisanus]|uniref:InfB_7 protein n=1 Tax=Fopius arisanus TaxID=64838 RepID=A0A0C9RTW0_9HYME|nr:PREDICTED: pollen-specific leucine-rich repeat extensin-like protein 4 isoform X2 [Fopius arisanus]
MRIDFNQLAKPANLQNSAVLKMLEEEEARKRNGGQPGLKRVTWPPPAGDDEIDFIEQSPVQAKTRGVGEYVSYETSPTSGPSPQPHNLTCASPQISTPLSPGGILRTPLAFQHQVPPKSWAPVTPPATSPLPAQISWGSPQSHQPVFKKSDSIEATPRHPAPISQPPPSIITLRPELPISQVPAPVYQAQPAATMAPISGNMRGDMKWPPASVKAQTEAENRARVELAKGPIFRPRRVNKDYSGFFAQHALNSTYPGYRAPPGTQYFTPAYQH